MKIKYIYSKCYQIIRKLRRWTNDLILAIDADTSPGYFSLEDFTLSYCPNCNRDMVVYSHGITGCCVCGKPLRPCGACDGCWYDACPYGNPESPETSAKSCSNLPIRQSEVYWYMKYRKKTRLKTKPSTDALFNDLPF